MKKKYLGFSLIELMVALTIALIILVALTQVYAGTRQTNRIQQMQSSVTDDGRYALNMLQRIISQAGFRPNTNSLLSSTRLAATSSTALSVSMTGDGANIINCDGALLANGTDYTASISFNSTTHKLSCGTSDWITPATGGQGTEVADFRILYGVDTAASPTSLDSNYLCGTTPNRDCVADSYISAPLAGANASQVVAVKICLILRSEASNTGVQRASAVKDCGGADINASSSDLKLYRTFQSTILLKNR